MTRAVRRILGTGAAMLALGIACAAPGMPPGGPPDSKGPVVRAISPDSNAVGVRGKTVLIHFDEVIAESPARPGGAGASGAARGLAALVQLSPTDGREEVRWRRTAIEIEPRRGFRPNTTYRVTLLPGVSDLRNNVTDAPLEFVFSTGSEIPTGTIDGVVFDWSLGGVMPQARVEVFPVADSALRWVARADSSGRFTVRDLAPGRYALRAWADQNNNRTLDLREVFDSATVTLADRATRELYAFVRDTVSPRIELVDLRDSTALRVRFDRGVAADWDPAGAVTLLNADSVPLPIGTMLSAARADSLAKSTARTADTVAVDSADVDVDVDVDVADDDLVAAADTVAADTMPPAPKFGRTAPIQLWALPLDTTLAPGTYVLRVRGVRGLSGPTSDVEREFRIREAPPAEADSTTPPRAPADPATRPLRRPR